MQLILLRSIKSINKCMFNKALVTKTTKHFFESAAQNVFANANSFHMSIDTLNITPIIKMHLLLAPLWQQPAVITSQPLILSCVHVTCPSATRISHKTRFKAPSMQNRTEAGDPLKPCVT